MKDAPLIVQVAAGGFLFFAGWTACLLFAAFREWAWGKVSEVLDRCAIDIDRA